MGFLAPWLLGGLALASAPIIIHLLNRRRFIVVDWAPMHYLKLTLRTNRKRLQLEQWLLLLVRTLVIIALFLAVARPIVSGTGLGALLGGQGRTSRVIVIDDTLSMHATVGGQSAFDRAKAVATELIERIGTKDSLTLVLATDPGNPLVREAHLDDPQPVLDQLAALKPVEAAAPWAGVFAAMDEHLEAATFPVREVTLITDLRAEGWTQDVTQQAELWHDGDVTLRILDVGATPAGNAALTQLKPSAGTPLVDTPLTFTALIKVEGDAQPATDQAILQVGDESRPIRLPELIPGQTHELTLSHTFTEPGEHTLTLTLPDDALRADNTRSAVVTVRRQLQIQLVDGEPAAGPFESEADFLDLAISVGRVPWRVDRVIDSEWLGSPMTAPDVVVLANVASITEQRAAELDEMVRAGMGLIVFAGDQLDPSVYNAALFRGGKGPMPAAIEAVVETDAKGLLIEPVDDSPLAALSELRAGALASIAPKRVLAVTPPRPAEGEGTDTVRVLAVWDTEDRQPAVIEKRHGNGRVLLLTVTADRDWSDWPTQPSYVLMLRQAALRLASGPGAGSADTEAGEPIVQTTDPARPPTRAAVSAPGSTQTVPAGIDRSDEKRPVIRHDATRLAGLYRLTWDMPGAGELARTYAVNPSAAESALDPIEHDTLGELLAPLEAEIIAAGDGSVSVAGNQVELWRNAAFALLALVLFESMLATWVGRER